MLNPVNEQLMLGLLAGDEVTFEAVYKQYLRPLHVYAITMLKNEDAAEGMVQNVFMKLWERKERIDIKGSVQAYLYSAVYNECLNYLRHQKVKLTHQNHVEHTMNNEQEHSGTGIELTELKEKLQLAMNDLPEKCRTIFQMSRFEELKYQEIADRLDISIKTVETQMGRALKTLRIKLVDYLPFIIWVINKIINPF